MTISDKIKIRFLSLKALTTWEAGFIHGLLEKERLTDKQKEKLNEIYSKVRFKKYKKFSVYEKYGHFESSMMWNDIHDFDR